MGLVPLLATIVFVALVVFVLLMWVRLVVEWVRALRPKWRPAGPVLVVAELAFAITDPPLRVVRRVVKPVRFGGVAIDFAWSIVFIVCLILLYVVGPLRFV